MNTLAIQVALDHIDELNTLINQFDDTAQHVGSDEIKPACPQLTEAQECLENCIAWPESDPPVDFIANAVLTAAETLSYCPSGEAHGLDGLPAQAPEDLIRERLAPAINAIPSKEPEIVTELRCTLADMGDPGRENEDAHDELCWEAMFTPESLIDEALSEGLIGDEAGFKMRMENTYGQWSSRADLVRRIEAQTLNIVPLNRRCKNSSEISLRTLPVQVQRAESTA